MTSPAISRNASFCSSTMAQNVGEPSPQEGPAFLFRVSGMSGCSTQEGNSIQNLAADSQALGLKAKLMKLLCLRG